MVNLNPLAHTVLGIVTGIPAKEIRVVRGALDRDGYGSPQQVVGAWKRRDDHDEE